VCGGLGGRDDCGGLVGGLGSKFGGVVLEFWGAMIVNKVLNGSSRG